MRSLTRNSRRRRASIRRIQACRTATRDGSGPCLNCGGNDRSRELQGTVNPPPTRLRLGLKVITIKWITPGANSHCPGFNATIWRGDKIGVVGLNGSGSHPAAVAAQEEPDSDGGSRHPVGGGYFDQLKAQVREDLSVAENVAPNGDTVESKQEAYSFLSRVSFAETARAPARMLSGGERARLLCQLSLQPANSVGRTHQ